MSGWSNTCRQYERRIVKQRDQKPEQADETVTKKVKGLNSKHTLSVMSLGPVVTGTTLTENAKVSTALDMETYKLSGLNKLPRGPPRIESMVPGSRSTKTALGTYLPAEASL